MSEYHEKLVGYLTQRVQAVAPNFSNLVGEIKAARLIAQAGSLINLSKLPLSSLTTVEGIFATPVIEMESHQNPLEHTIIGKRKREEALN